jgi:hypothetical protein
MGANAGQVKLRMNWTFPIAISPHDHNTVYAGSQYVHATSDGGIRLWVDNRKLVDTWGEPGVKEESGTLNLVAGQKVKVVVESRGGLTAKLAWSGPSQKKQTPAKARLFEPDGSAGGLQGDYFEDADLRTKKLSRVDAKIEFDWSQKGPFPLDSRQRGFEALIDVQAGSYTADWVNPKTGSIDKSQNFSTSGGSRALGSPLFSEDVALRIKRQ